VDELETILQGPPPKDSRRRCCVADWLARQDDGVKRAFNTAVTGDEWTGKQLCDLMQERGFANNADRVRIHRRGDCSCGK